MKASAAVRGLFRIPRAGPPLGWIEASEDRAHRCDSDAQVENVRNVLARCGYTVTQLSAATRRRYGSKSPFFIPETLLYKVKNGITPHVCQIVALSESTGYRFADWLRMFGFDLQQIPRLQMRLHAERTVLVTPNEEFQPALPPSPACYGMRSASACTRAEQWNGRGRYLFAKIGNEDALVYPELIPGSVVRVDRWYTRRMNDARQISREDLFWLVEHPGGLTCCQVRWIDDRQIVLLPCRSPWGSWPLRLPREARILGLVDTDLHPTNLPPSAVAWESGPPLLPSGEEKMRFSDLLRISRARTGLTFRAAHNLTRAIAQILDNQEYTIALGLLSDYEAMDKLPRHIAKILSLCITYCMDIRHLMEAASVAIDDSAKLSLPIPDRRPQSSPPLLEHAAHHGTDERLSSYSRSSGVL